MATEQSPPQIRIILTVAFSSVVILAALNAVFRSYYLMMTEEVAHEHLAKPTELLKLREGEKVNLTSSPVPIAQAMQQVAQRGRGNPATLADIAPQPSNDLGPMVGWVRNQDPVWLARAAAAAEVPAPTSATGDAGAAPAAAGGAHAAPAAATSDAGAAALPGKPAPMHAAAKDAGVH